MMRFLPCGDDAVLVELSDLEAAVALARSLAARPVPGMVDAVPGSRTVLVQLAPHADRDAVRGDLLTRTGSTHAPDDAETVEVGVVYDGEDLDEVAALTGLTPAEVVERHAAAVYEVAFTGFAPGFAYLSGLDPALHVPRRRRHRRHSGRGGCDRRRVLRRLSALEPRRVAAARSHARRDVGSRPHAACYAPPRHARALRSAGTG